MSIVQAALGYLNPWGFFAAIQAACGRLWTYFHPEETRLEDLFPEARKTLERGVVISETAQRMIKENLHAINDGNTIEGITRLQAVGNHVFTILDENLVFKICRNPEQRFKNMVTAVAFCKAHNLDRLVIPHAALFEVNGTTVIAEEKLDAEFDQDKLAELYETTPGLEEAIAQLAQFTIGVQFDDAAPRNCVPLDGGRIGLVDLEDIGEFRRGDGGDRLLQTVVATESQAQAACKVLGRNIAEVEDRLEAIAKRRAFHARKGLHDNPTTTLEVDIDTLGLDLNTKKTVEGKSMTLGEFTERVIARINKRIKCNRSTGSTESRRRVEIRDLYIDDEWLYMDSTFLERGEKAWINRVLNALIKQGHIFSVDDNGIIQA